MTNSEGRPWRSERLRGCGARGRFPSGAMPLWEFERDGAVVRLEPTGPLLASMGTATDLAVDAAIAGTGSGALEPVLQPWWQRFPGPFLYYPGRRLVPASLQALAFIDFIKLSASAHSAGGPSNRPQVKRRKQPPGRPGDPCEGPVLFEPQHR